MKHLLYISIFLFSFFELYAQDTLYRRVYGSTGNDYGISVTETNYGFALSGNTDDGWLPSNDIFITAIDSNGNELWQKIINLPNEDVCKKIIRTQDNGLLICGFTNSKGFGGYDALLIKTDSVGDTLWTKTYGGWDWDIANDVKEDASGNLYVVGETYSFSNNNDLFVVKSNSLGDTVWTKSYGTDSTEYARGIAFTYDNHLLVAATVFNGKKQIMLYKINQATGDTIWTNRTTSSADIIANDVAVSPDSTIFVCGEIDNGIQKDMFLARYDTAGNVLWTTVGGGSADEEAYSMVINKDLNPVICGYSTSFGQGKKDVQAYHFHKDGWFIFGPGSGGLENEWANQIITTKNNGYALIGSTNSFGFGAYDVYFIKTDSTLTLDNIVLGNPIVSLKNVQLSSEFKVFPNPTNGKLNFIADETILAIKIKDLLGKEIFTITNQTSNLAVDLSHLKNGCYVFQIKTTNHFKVGTIIKI
ncbi:MAG: lipoprotein [Vicingaceae bacterium]